jgi:hypothetical protein
MAAALASGAGAFGGPMQESGFGEVEFGGEIIEAPALGGRFAGFFFGIGFLHK